MQQLHKVAFIVALSMAMAGSPVLSAQAQPRQQPDRTSPPVRLGPGARPPVPPRGRPPAPPQGRPVLPQSRGSTYYRPNAAAPRGGRIQTPRFSAREFSRFNPTERTLWTSGYWRHEWHNNLYGWWWVVGGIWYFYAAPVYPYPLYVSDYSWQEPLSPIYPSGYWYYCSASQAYYPYVQTCDVPWTPVSPVPTR